MWRGVLCFCFLAALKSLEKNHLASNAANIQLKPTVANYALYWLTGRQVGRWGSRLGWWLAMTADTLKDTHECMSRHRETCESTGGSNTLLHTAPSFLPSYLPSFLPSVSTDWSGKQGVAGRLLFVVCVVLIKDWIYSNSSLRLLLLLLRPLPLFFHTFTAPGSCPLL